LKRLYCFEKGSIHLTPGSFLPELRLRVSVYWKAETLSFTCPCTEY
jgi:hypothetical protein